MGDKLVERFHARSTRIAVFEEQDRARLRLLDQTVELVEVLEWCQVRVHLSSSLTVRRNWP